MTVQPPSTIAPSLPVAAQRSPWHSPVPYLFGGLAAMLGLIAFALLILACTYWKLSGDLENATDGERDLEAGDGDGDSKPSDNKEPFVLEEKYLVIVAGQEKPTFLATPVSSRATSFCSCSCRSNSTTLAPEVEMTEEKEKKENTDQVQVRNTQDHKTADHIP